MNNFIFIPKKSIVSTLSYGGLYLSDSSYNITVGDNSITFTTNDHDTIFGDITLSNDKLSFTWNGVDGTTVELSGGITIMYINSPSIPTNLYFSVNDSSYNDMSNALSIGNQTNSSSVHDVLTLNNNDVVELKLNSLTDRNNLTILGGYITVNTL